MTSSLSVGWVSFVTGGSSKLFTLSEAVKVGERVVCRSNRCALVNCLRLFLFFLCCLLLLFCWSRHILLGFTVWRRFIFTRRLLRGSHRRTFCVRTLARSRTGSVSLSLIRWPALTDWTRREKEPNRRIKTLEAANCRAADAADGQHSSCDVGIGYRFFVCCCCCWPRTIWVFIAMGNERGGIVRWPQTRDVKNTTADI